ncbi:MAG: hypothetical protein AAF636_13365 [Pseudomonadota bacterium]
MSQTSQERDGPEVPFQCVDSVSDEIFDRLVEIDRVEELTPTEAAATKTRLQKLGEYLLESAPKLGTDAAMDISDTQPEFDFALMVEGEEQGAYFGMSRAAGNRQKARKQSIEEYEAERVSYHAARQLSNLPQGIELLEGQASDYNETDVMSAIKGVMVEQKRQQSAEHLPPLAPQQAPLREAAITEHRAEASTGTGPRIAEFDLATASIPSLLRRVLAQFFLRDTVLAVSLSVWAALVLMAFIEPSASVLLIGKSVYLLFIFAVVFRQSGLMTPITLLGRRSACNMGGHAGA